MIWRSLCLAVCVTLAAGDAVAQRIRVEGPEGVPLIIEPIGDAATIESVTAQLSEALANYDNSNISVRQGLVRPGDEIATIVVGYEDTARLTADVTRSGALGGRVVVLPAGTPVYAHAFVNADMIFVHGETPQRRMWCGVHNSEGYCLLQRRGEWEVAPVRGGSPYAFETLGAFVPASAPGLNRDDVTVLNELPLRTQVYRLASMRGASARIARTMRVGDDEHAVEDLRAGRFRLGSLMIELSPGAERGTATVRATPLDPADYQSDLRAWARQLVAAPRN